jgi:hypothetical protein
MSDTPTPARKGIPTPIMLTFVITLILAMVAIAWTQLPRAGISTDLTVIGQGQPVLVLTRDVNYLGGAQVLEMLKPIQGDYAERASFRIAHLGQPDGRSFADRHGTSDGDITLLDAKGNLLETVVEPPNAAQVEDLLSRHGI